MARSSRSPRSPRSRPSHTSRSRRNPNPVVQEALEVTWTLKGHLKSAQISYLRVGGLLARVREKKLWAALHHPDIESYAAARLGLQRRSLYRYLQVYDWTLASHPEWLQPKPKGFIPDLADATALMWIEKRLARKDLDARTRAALEELQKKALAGQLTKREFDDFRGHGGGGDFDLRGFLLRLKRLREMGAEIEGMKDEVIRDLDLAIAVLEQRRAADAR